LRERERERENGWIKKNIYTIVLLLIIDLNVRLKRYYYAKWNVKIKNFCNNFNSVCNYIHVYYRNKIILRI